MASSTVSPRIWEKRRKNAPSKRVKPFLLFDAQSDAKSPLFLSPSFQEFAYGFTATRFRAQLFPVKQKLLLELASGENEVWF
jgi:hypothetical protein